MKIKRIEISDDDTIFYFEGSDHPWSIQEFKQNTITHTMLREIEDLIAKLAASSANVSQNFN